MKYNNNHRINLQINSARFHDQTCTCQRYVPNVPTTRALRTKVPPPTPRATKVIGFQTHMICIYIEGATFGIIPSNNTTRAYYFKGINLIQNIGSEGIAHPNPHTHTLLSSK